MIFHCDLTVGYHYILSSTVVGVGKSRMPLRGHSIFEMDTPPISFVFCFAR